MTEFCFEIVILDLDSQKINYLEFIVSLVIFLDNEIFKKGYVIFLLICFNVWNGWFNDCISNVNSRLNRKCGRDSVLKL